MPVLNRPSNFDAIYLARGDEVNPHRPLFTGDVLAELEIPGVDDPGPAVLLDHPCSMRRGHKLRSRLLAARLLPKEDLIEDGAWPVEGHYDWFPLPDLSPQHEWMAIRLDLVGRVPSAGLIDAQRLACISLEGAALLWQRKVHRETRFFAPLDRLLDLIEPEFAEAEIWEEWADAFVPPLLKAGTSLKRAVEATGKEFAQFLDDNGLREALKDQGRRPGVRRATMAEIRARMTP